MHASPEEHITLSPSQYSLGTLHGAAATPHANTSPIKAENFMVKSD